MKGYVAFGEAAFDRGYQHGRAEDTSLMVHLTIDVDDVARLEADPGAEAQAHGYVHCEALGGRLAIEHGSLHLFAPGPAGADRRMLYRLTFADGSGHPLTVSGFKRLERGPPTRLWPQTTTLYTRVLQGHVDAAAEAGAELVASGILRITGLDFLRQLSTMRGSAAPAREQAGIVARFARLFIRELARLYGPARR
jgi:cholesterol oxidase